jgi:hypothetical protein
MAVYQRLVATGTAPEPDAIAAETALSFEAAVAALRELAGAHVLVLEADGRTIRFAAPFSAVETGFQVTCAGHRYFAPCAWDAFGIPAALHANAHIDTSCADSGKHLACGTSDGRVYGEGIVHLVVPAAHFWDDIAYT